MTQDLDLTPGVNPGSLGAFCVVSTCHLSSHRVVWALVLTSRKITHCKFVIYKCKHNEHASGIFNSFGIILRSVWVGLPPTSVAFAWSGHMALIWDPSVSVSLSKARKTPRVPPVSQQESVTAAFRISPLFTIHPRPDICLALCCSFLSL